MKGVGKSIAVLISVLIAFSSAYEYQSSKSYFGEGVTVIALAPKSVNMGVGEVNIAIGFNNGTILLTNTNNFGINYMYSFLDKPIIALDWNQGGIFSACFNKILVFNPSSILVTLQLNFTQSIYTVSFGYNSPMLMTGVSFANRIDIYQNNRLVMTRSTQQASRTTTFDYTGKYFYYFDSFTRYILNVPARTIFNSYYTTIIPVSITASSKSGYEDITATVDTAGNARLWDDFSLLDTYSKSYPQSMAKFTGDSNYLVTYQPIQSVLTLWRTSFAGTNPLTISQQFSMTISSVSLNMDAENDLIVYLADQSIYIYKADEDTPSSLVLIIVLSVFGCILCVGLIAFFVKRRAAIRRQQEYQNIDHHPGPIPYSGNQGFNNNQGWNNNQPPNNQGWNNNQGFNPNNQGWNNNQGYNNNPGQGFAPAPSSSNPYGKS